MFVLLQLLVAYRISTHLGEYYGQTLLGYCSLTLLGSDYAQNLMTVFSCISFTFLELWLWAMTDALN